MMRRRKQIIQSSEHTKTRLSAARIAVFTHDTFGLGHIRRCLHIMNAVTERSPDTAMLLVTGSPVVHALQSLPANADYVKIPTIVKTGAQGSQPPHLPIALPEVQLMRERLIEEAVLSFDPDLFLVDNFPLGAQRELLPTLKQLRQRGVPAIIGLRDIVDAPDVVCADWKRQGIYEILDRYYDRILIYGVKEVLNAQESYQLPPQTASKVHYCGYVTEQPIRRRSSNEIKKELGITGAFVLVTGGGGGDAFPLLQTFLSALKFLPKTSALVLTGPLMGPADLNKLRSLVNGRQDVVIRDFVKDLPNYMSAADAIISMCGYNIAAEILTQRTRAIVVPRTWRYGEHTKGNQAGLEWEQILRARSLAKAGLVDLIEPDELKPKLLASRINAVLTRPKKRSKSEMDMRGLHNAVKHIISLSEEGSRRKIHV